MKRQHLELRDLLYNVMRKEPLLEAYGIPPHHAYHIRNQDPDLYKDIIVVLGGALYALYADRPTVHGDMEALLTEHLRYTLHKMEEHEGAIVEAQLIVEMSLRYNITTRQAASILLDSHENIRYAVTLALLTQFRLEDEEARNEPDNTELRPQLGEVSDPDKM